MLVVMIVPTGIGAEIGGHSGDATSAAHLLAECCDQLILNPNVVNASDITEQPANSLYVEGAMLNAFLSGRIRLKPVKQNNILVVCNEINDLTVNSVNAMRSILGITAKIVKLRTELTMTGYVDSDTMTATGTIMGVDELVDQVDQHEYDALAVHTPIHVMDKVAEEYVKNGGINPWGGVEAMLSKEIYWQTEKPNAHAPLEGRIGYEVGITDPRLAPEIICNAHLGCVLRGLHKAPRPSLDSSVSIGVGSVEAMVSPMCWGTPHKICRERGIPMIFVEENQTYHYRDFRSNFVESDGYLVRNYIEAAGLLILLGMGRSYESIIRPIESVKITEGN